MRNVGLLCPTAPGGTPPGDFAREAEALGFESLWVGEHPAVPATLERSYVQLVDGEVPYFYTNVADPWITLAHIAGATRRIRLGTAVSILPLRHPLLLARELATLDRQSGGRVILGAGAGWLIEEMELFGAAFKTRFDQLRERVEAMRKIWTEDLPEYHGEHVDFPPILSRYHPIQQPIPVLCGIHGPRGLREAAKWGSGWLPVSSGADELSRDIATLAELCRSEGRDIADLDITSMLGIEASDSAEAAEAIFEAGATRVILAVGTTTTRNTTLERDSGEHPLAPSRYQKTLATLAERFLA
jgi:probable F420-dependent oxidoreductase